MKIDAHQHFWQYVPSEFPWINADMRILQQDYLPDTLWREQDRIGFEASVVVQARQSLAETDFLLELAEKESRILGVVGWLDLRAPDVEEQVKRYAAHPKLVGLRHIVHDEPDDDFLLREDFQHGLSLLADVWLTYDLLLFPRHLSRAISVVEKFPKQAFVLDHIAKPPIKAGLLEPWESDFQQLARFPNVHCKLSGLVTEADWGGWQVRDFEAYLQVAWEAFGEDRLMIGSDWPVCLLSAEYAEVMNITLDFLSQFSDEIQQKILGDNCQGFYGLE